MKDEQSILPVYSLEIINEIAGDSIMARNVAASILETKKGFQHLENCKKYSIYGRRLVVLYSVLCRRSIFTLQQTLRLLDTGVYKQKEIEENLDSSTPVPFINTIYLYPKTEGDTSSWSKEQFLLYSFLKSRQKAE